MNYKLVLEDYKKLQIEVHLNVTKYMRDYYHIDVEGYYTLPTIKGDVIVVKVAGSDGSDNDFVLDDNLNVVSCSNYLGDL